MQQTRQYLIEILALGGYELPGQTSLILLQHALHQPKTWVLSHGEFELNQDQQHKLHTYLQQCLQGVPLPYVLGRWVFFGRSFQVTPAVLIPRPETEGLVEIALEHAHSYLNPKIIDVGTGSGAIAVSLAAELPTATVLGVDLSMDALRVAQSNAQRLCPNRVHFLQGNLLAPFAAQFDLICANLPYIPRAILADLPVSHWEPRLALDGGKSGLDSIHHLLEQAQSRLSPNGVILLETESSLGAETLSAAQEAFPTAHHRLIPDLAGHDRIVEIKLRRK